MNVCLFECKQILVMITHLVSRETLETDKQRTSNIKEAGTIGNRLFPYSSVNCKHCQNWLVDERVYFLP